MIRNNWNFIHNDNMYKKQTAGQEKKFEVQ